MTKEEAIFCEKSYLGETNCIDCKYYGTDTCESRESHKMAISALEQIPITTSTDEPVVINYPIIICDDVASREREAIINAIYKMELSNWVKDEIEKTIRELPPVDFCGEFEQRDMRGNINADDDLYRRKII